jgi:hypothetical protein
LGIPAAILLVVGFVGCPQISNSGDGSNTVVAPKNLVVTASTSAISISLSWTASTTSGATYRVYRGTSAGGEATTPIGTSTTANYSDTDSTLQPNTTYYYYIRAVSDGVESAKSNEAHATTANLTGGPAPTVTFKRVDPSVFFDPPYNYDLVDQCAWLTWQGPASGVSYTVLRSTDPSFSNPEGTDVTSLGTSGTGYVNAYFYDESTGYDFYDNTALLGQTYYYEVFETNEANGGVSLPSSVVTAGAPAPKNVKAVENGDTTVTVSWDSVPDATDYYIGVVDSSGILRVDFQTHNASTSITLSSTDYSFQNGTYYFVMDAYVSDWGYYSLSNPLTYSVP